MKFRMPVLLVALSLGIVTKAQDEDRMALPPEEMPSRFVRGRVQAADDSVVPQTRDAAARSKRQAHVEIDPSTRTLIITTDHITSLQVEEVIRALDKPVPQALIKVLFLEVTHNDDLDIGLVNLAADSLHQRDNRGTNSNDNYRSPFHFGVNVPTSSAGVVSILQNDIDVTMRALAEVGKLNVLSRPSILTRNNQEATITIGQEVPFIRNTRITSDGQIINTVEYEDIGIILTVTPHIRADGLIELALSPEISTLTGETVSISDNVNAPVFAKRSAETHVVVPSGRTVIIGGLMEDQETRNVRKVPLLGDIPLLGALFRRTVTTKQKTELLIFLTPTVVADSAELVELTQREREGATLVQQNHAKERLERYLDDNETRKAAK